MIYLDGMQGLGDNVYQRAVLHELTAQRGPVTLITSWPQIYVGMQVTCVRSRTPLRTQRRNLGRRDLPFAPLPLARFQGWSYGMRGTMLQGLFDRFGLNPAAVRFDLPQMAPVEPPGTYVVVRPATLRREWRSGSRSPRPEYLDQAARRLGRSYHVISVADLAPGFEWIDGVEPFAHRRYHAGELQLEKLLALVAHAAAVVGGVGWLVPVAVAYRVPMLLLFGGWGMLNGPERIFDPRMDTNSIDQVLPDEFCRCNDRAHACDKRVADIGERIERFVVALGRRTPAAMAA